MEELIKGESTICEPMARKNIKAKASRKTKEERKYSFDLEKADAIFYWLFQNMGEFVLRLGTESQKTDRGKENDYCKCHESFTHLTRDCITFRNLIHDLIESKDIVFPETKETLIVDESPFKSMCDIKMFEINY